MAQQTPWNSRSSNRSYQQSAPRELSENDFKPVQKPDTQVLSPLYNEELANRVRQATPQRRQTTASRSSSGNRSNGDRTRNTSSRSSSTRSSDERRRSSTSHSSEARHSSESRRSDASSVSRRTGQGSGSSSSSRSAGTRSSNAERSTTASRRTTESRSNASRNTDASRGKRTGAVIQKEEPQRRRLFNLPSRAESNFTIVAVTIVLMFIGLIMITSSSYSYAYSEFDNSLYFFWRQLMWIGVSIIAMIFMTYFPLRLVKQASFAIYVFSIICSILVLFIGNTANGSTRWLGVGTLSFQPAELAKLAVALYISNYVDRNHDKMGELPTFLRTLILVGIPTALVGYENLSSGLIIGVMGVIIMFVGGAKVEHFIKIIGPLFLLLVLVLVVPLLFPEDKLPGFMADFLYRSNRIKAWLNPWDYSLDEGYQTIQALYAVGSGGFFGRGLGQSIQKLGYIPEAYNDIIFAIICEELGAFGAGIVIILFGIYTWNGIKISIMAPNTYTALVSSAIIGQISVQAIMNIAVNTNSIPATGISLPFISYGGSSLLFLMASVGILLNISTYSNRGDVTL